MKKVIEKIIGVILIAIMILPYVSMAATQADLVNNKNKLKATEKQKEEVTQEKKETVKEVEKISSQISDYENQINELDAKISDLNKKIEENQNKLNEAQKNYDKQQDLLEARLVATYEAGETSYLDVILSSESITDLISNYYLVTEVATNDAELLEQIQQQKKEIEKAKADLESNKQELATSKSSKQSVTTQLQTAKNQKNQEVAKLSEEEKDLQNKIDELKAANAQINKEIEAANKKYQQQLENLNKNKPSGGNNSSSGGSASGGTSSSGFIKPVNSYVTTGMYYSSGQYHGAVDFGAGGINGAPVYAVADGVVYLTRALTTSYGNYIIIAHANGLYTLYAHGQAGSIAVSEGQTVRQGQQIMRVGSTGNSSGPHLHFEVRVSPGGYSNRVNPLNYLP